MNTRFFTCIAVSGFALTAGCALGPRYERPTVVTPPTWKESEPAATATALSSDWWTIFNDAGLNALESQALAANKDLQRAAARVAEARALARLSEAELYPNVSADATHARFRTSVNRVGGTGATANDRAAQLGLGYELDFWGRVRSAANAARADAAAVAGDLAVAQLILTSDLAGHYFQLRSLDAERAIIEATIALRRDAVRLQETRNQAGLINEADVTRARTELANVEAELHAVTRSRARLEHALAVLCGQPPSGFAVAARETPFALPQIPAGLPSTLLQRRPDLAAAEARLQAAGARIAVAKADFFPRFSLTGAAGFASTELNSLLKGDSRAWSFGPGLHLPLFDGGSNRANLAAAEARYDQSIAAYRQSVLAAFRDVEDSLSDLGTLAAQSEAIDRAILAARDTAAIASERYQKGLSNYLDVVDAQRAALQSERTGTQLRSQRFLATVQLTRALGGGWEPAVQ